ncbi:Protein of unknown function DUF58 [Rhodoblastus acidophilus]|uniref:DUF58 domain-containing protein n=1 Tax=Rhodoblastus acidophilus TaxID=1074 RepID=A0A212RWE3_RHOAC|nr:DUF58 domain-containing protein [Rhodoblastus acidophilus]PPQ38362.1 DUF58 domain-containing protein [Rhodoblastus acidophilus]RAI20036.1 DUF58 domain-containing protein [Rhodoblastus acidophilus]SNB76951.1 Protein of unknown function DUF58 [Rhodoblastus acidophilus]
MGAGFQPKESIRPDAAKSHAAVDLARRLPGLTLSARHAAASVAAGLHGRRRAGMGENFWQFRPFISGETAQNVDWRRSGRDDRLYVREREWEAAQVLWVWADLSPSMNFRSALAEDTKADRALVLALALADACVRGGERAGFLGMTPLFSAADVIERLALAVLTEARRRNDSFPDLPPPARTRPREKVALIGDFLVDPAEFDATLARLSAQGAQGCALMLFDPVEENFPFVGQTEFFDEDGAKLRAGRAEDFAEIYAQKLAAHRAALMDSARARGFTFALHATDRPATEALLRLRQGLGEGR